MRNFAFNAMLCLTILGLQACVTTSNRPQVNVDSAHDKRIELGQNYLFEGMRDNARYQFSKALELKSNSAEAYQGIAMVHQGNGELEPAEEAFKKALRYSSNSNISSIRVSYGNFLILTGKVEDACELFEKSAVDYDYKGRAEALYFAGRCAAKLGNTLRERSALEHSLNLNPNAPAVVLDLAEIYFKAGEYPKAKALLDRMETLAEPTARSLWLSIRIERIFGNRDKEASLALLLKNNFPYSKEYLEYKQLKSKK